MKRYFVIFLTVLAAIGLPRTTTHAAEIQPIGAEAEAIRKREKIKLEKPRKPVIEEEEIAPLPAIEGEKLFFVKKINIEGNSIIPEKELRPMVTPFENKEVTFTQVHTAAVAITNFYRAKGYVTSAAYFPPQKIDRGEITIRVMEGKIDRIIIEGARYFRKNLILKGIKEKLGDIFDYYTLEKDLLKLNLHPDREIKAVLIPGSKPETSDIILNVKDTFPVHAGYSFDNLGTRLSGELRHGFILKDTNFLTLDDIFYAKAIVSERHDLVGVVTDYLLPLNNGMGTAINFGFSWIRSELGKELKFAKVIGHASSFTPGVTQPIFETKYLDLSLNTGFNFKDSYTKLSGDVISYDNIRSWTVVPNFTEKDKWGKTYFTNRFNFGFSNFLGGSSKNDMTSRPGSGSQFFHYDIDATRLQPFVFESVLIYRANVQITQTNLLPAEQLRIGGAETIRGYSEGEFLGDYGYVQSAELRVPPYFIPKEFSFPGTKQRVWESVQLVYFVDVGKAYLWKPLSGEQSSMMLAGTGMGLRLSLARYVSARLDWAWPLGDRPLNNNPRPRFHFSLNAEY